MIQPKPNQDVTCIAATQAMPEVLATKPEDAASVRDFLAGVFQLPLDSRFISPGIFEWKYFRKRPDWNKPRSYILREHGSLVAHIGLWPLRFRGPFGDLTGIQALDWASSPERPGAGSHLRLALEEMADFGLGVGGSVAAQRARIRLGFQAWGKMSVFVRVIRPYLKLRQVTAGSQVRRLGRLGRDLLHHARSFSPVASTWSAEVVRSFHNSLDKVLSAGATGEVRPYRSASTLNYLLACPDSNCRGLIFRCRGSVCGYALLSQVGGQARIATLWAPDDWDVAYRLTTNIASQDPTVYEVVAGVNCSSEETALQRNGYRLRNIEPIAIKDPRKVVPPNLPLSVQFAGSDLFLL